MNYPEPVIESEGQELRGRVGEADAEGGGVGLDKPRRKGRTATEKYKIQIQLSERAKDRLFQLVERTEADTAAQVVRDALRIYDILVEEISEGGSELFLKDGQTGEVVRLKVF